MKTWTITPVLAASVMALAGCGGGSSGTAPGSTQPAGFAGSGLTDAGPYTGALDSGTLGASVNAAASTGTLPTTSASILLPGTTGTLTQTALGTIDVTALGETITLSNTATGDPAIYSNPAGSFFIYVGPNQTSSVGTVLGILDPNTNELDITVAAVGDLSSGLPGASTSYTVNTIFQILRGDGAFATLSGAGDTITANFAAAGTPITGTLTLTDDGNSALGAVGGADGTVDLTITDSLIDGSRFAITLDVDPSDQGDLLSPAFDQVNALGGFFGPGASEIVAGVGDTGTQSGTGDDLVLLGSIVGQ